MPDSISQPDKCRSCGESILFARNAKTGKWMPFESGDREGLWSLTNGIATYVGKAPADPVEGVSPLPRFSSHFSRCPSAGAWRRKKG